MGTKKITLVTVKSFIKKNRANLLINVKSSFDGMTDCVQSLHQGFKTAEEDNSISKSESYYAATMGIKGAWFVGSSRDYFYAFENDLLVGYEISNSCGSFILAIEKTKNNGLTTRSTRNQIRLNKAASRYSKRVQSGANTVRYY